MTSIEIHLPDGLAQAAARAGLLHPDRLIQLIARQLRSQALLERLERIRAPESEAMSAEEIQVEIDAVRAQRRRPARA